ncbi:MAG: NAD(P)H-dependent oxidoreductase [Clostridia bacterium]|nr:NAD(P)H-dependent oxidoreductase [Clostridia bacterium]
MMTIAVFHGSPRKGNTYLATKIVMNELAKCGDIHCSEFFLPDALPLLCTGCMLCFGGFREKCPHARYVTPIVNELLTADALVFATPHYGACSMPGAMKNLLDHLAFLEFNVAPKAEMFQKKALVLTTGAGSTAALKPVVKFLRHWGVNRVFSLGFRMFAHQWDQMPKTRQARFEKKLRLAARKFFNASKGAPYLSTVFHYHLSKFILKRYVGEGNYPYEYWKEKGYFKKRPF